MTLLKVTQPGLCHFLLDPLSEQEQDSRDGSFQGSLQAGAVVSASV